MAVLLRNNSVFLHIPKTGGTWVRKVLRAQGMINRPIGHGHSDWDRSFWYGHMQAKPRVLRHLFRSMVRSRRAPEIKSGCYRFCFVREPLSWYESWWRFMQRMEWKQFGSETCPFLWHPTAMLNDLGSGDFNTFVRNVNRKRPGFVTELYSWYVRPGINYVGKMESLEHDLIEVLTRLGEKVDAGAVHATPLENSSDDAVPMPEWDPAVRAETLKLEYASYVRFGYEQPVAA